MNMLMNSELRIEFKPLKIVVTSQSIDGNSDGDDDDYDVGLNKLKYNFGADNTDGKNTHTANGLIQLLSRLIDQDTHTFTLTLNPLLIDEPFFLAKCQWVFRQSDSLCK